MFWDDDGWPRTLSVAERRKTSQRQAAALRKRGRVLSPVVIEGRKIATTFWGTAWNRNLEDYHDYANRLPRGRSYVLNGSVIDLQIAAGGVEALVSGSSLYHVTIAIKKVPDTIWRAVCRDCTGSIDSLVDLLSGSIPKSVMERLCVRRSGLFPEPKEIRFACDCPDRASMCKHVAAVLYGVGARLDAEPELLFRLRAVDAKDLVAGIGSAFPASPATSTRRNVLRETDAAALFGIDMDVAEEPRPPKPAAKAPEKTAIMKKTTRKKPAGTVAARKRPQR